MANKHTKRFSASIIIREIQIKTTIKYHLTSLRMAIIKYLQTINSGEGVEEKEPSYTFGGNVNWYTHCGEMYRGSSKNKNRTTRWPIPGDIPRENHNSKRY